MPGAGLLDRLTPQDLMMLWPGDLGWPEDIAAVAVLDGTGLLDEEGRIRIDAVRGLIGSKLHLVPRFRQILCRPTFGLGWPLWVDAPSFDLADHVRVHPVTAPGGEAQLVRACEGLLGRRLNPGRPLWEMWLLPGLAGRRVGLFVKVHHSVADGVAGMASIGALLEVFPNSPAVVAQPWSPATAPTGPALLRDNLRRRSRGVRRTLSSLPDAHDRNGGPHQSPWREYVDYFRQQPAPRTSLNRPIGSERRLLFVRAGLRVVKDIAHVRGATVNDVVLTAVAGGLRDLLRSRGEDVEDLALRVLVPVSLHGHQEGLATGNRDAMIVVSLPVGEVDPVRRLQLIARQTAVLKKQPRSVTASGPMRWPMVQRLSTRFLARQRFLNLSVTNVPGPPTPLYLGGGRLLELFPVGPLLGNMTLGVAVVSYDGQLNLTAVADRDTCPDVDVFADGVRAAFHELTSSVAVWAHVPPKLAVLS